MNTYYRLGCYNENGEKEEIAIELSERNARKRYKSLKEIFRFSIWVEKIESVDTSDWNK